jgi:hypothetical protein
MNRTKLAVLACCVGLGLAGCASAPVSYYRLDTDGGAGAASVVASPRVQVGPVAVPPWLDRQQIVLDDGSGRLQVLDQSRWAAPLPNMIAAALARSVGRSFGGATIDAWPSASPLAADWRVVVEIHALQAQPGKGLHLDAAWRIEHDGKVAATGRRVADFPAAQGMDGLIAAHDAALDQLGADVAAGLRRVIR